MDIGVGMGVEVFDLFNYLEWFLGAIGGIEVCEGMAMKGAFQDRKVSSDVVDVDHDM